MCDISTGTPRPFVPPQYRRAVFHSLHALSHPGIRATRKLVAARYVWPGMNSDVKRWTQSCLQCQQSQIQRHTVTSIATFATHFDWVHIDIVGHFDWVHIDIVGTLPVSKDFTYLLTCVDRFTRWLEAFPIAYIE